MSVQFTESLEFCGTLRDSSDPRQSSAPRKCCAIPRLRGDWRVVTSPQNPWGQVVFEMGYVSSTVWHNAYDQRVVAVDAWMVKVISIRITTPLHHFVMPFGSAFEGNLGGKLHNVAQLSIFSMKLAGEFREVASIFLFGQLSLSNPTSVFVPGAKLPSCRCGHQTPYDRISRRSLHECRKQQDCLQ